MLEGRIKELEAENPKLRDALEFMLLEWVDVDEVAFAIEDLQNHFDLDFTWLIDALKGED